MSDLVCIGELRGLESLRITRGLENAQADFEFVGSLVNLKTLVLGGLKKVDLSFIPKLTRLKYLWVSRVRELRGLGELLKMPENSTATLNKCGNVSKEDREELRVARPDMWVRPSDDAGLID